MILKFQSTSSEEDVVSADLDISSYDDLMFQSTSSEEDVVSRGDLVPM